MGKAKRWVLLEHTGSPNDPKGRHFDLMLEGKESCKTWQLRSFPIAGGPAREMIPLPDHDLKWLEKTEAIVSGNRGKAKRVLAGTYIVIKEEQSSTSQKIKLEGIAFMAILDIEGEKAKFLSKLIK